ncbi:MAG: hypothetical protein KDA74_03135 [Planctomycetaceae bacterium]|nr:hypothetical protein [Planctomycetaceae bacterium]
MRWQWCFGWAVVVGFYLSGTSEVSACPFCSAPTLTLAEQLQASQSTALVQWVGGKEADPDEGFAGVTEYEIVRMVNDESSTLKKGERVTLERYRQAGKGDLFLLLGNVIDEKIEWSSPLEVTETSFNYIVQAPSTDAPTTERLRYYMKFLEYPDELIATDAYGEFANAPYADITPLSKEMPREKLREWLRDESTVPTRIGLYGLMLGLCGNADDAIFLKEKIMEPTEDFRLGIDGVMGGYLLLAGESGLELIDQEKLANRNVQFSETFAAMQALRFMWTYGDGRIDKERLRKSMRLLLDRPELTDLVVADLARWDDWSVLDRLMDMYGTGDYDIPSIKRAIVRYLLVASKGKNKKGGGPDAATAEKAKKLLDKLRQEDPKTVQSAERFFFLK